MCFVVDLLVCVVVVGLGVFTSCLACVDSCCSLGVLACCLVGVCCVLSSRCVCSVSNWCVFVVVRFV